MRLCIKLILLLNFGKIGFSGVPNRQIYMDGGKEKKERDKERGERTGTRKREPKIERQQKVVAAAAAANICDDNVHNEE